MSFGRSPNNSFGVYDAGSLDRGCSSITPFPRMVTTQVAPEPPRFCASPTLMARDLPWARISSELHHYVADLSDSRCTDRMPFGFQTATGIDRDGSANGSASRCRKRASIAFPNESKVLGSDNLSDGEAIVQFSELYIAGPKACTYDTPSHPLFGRHRTW